jgi:diketogulonate reductase-like aldo/keto reductase
MGTWLTFDVGPEPVALGQRRAVLQAFFAGGGALIDTSPMYGRAEEVVGDLLGEPGRAAPVFSATKVWTSGRLLGERQLVRSMGYWRLRRFDLVQVHNMLDWTTHLPWLRDWQAQGKIRYLGITTSHGRLHEALEAAMRREPFDFVQFTYSLADRSAESRLLPLAADRGMAVIANRPFDGGDLFDRVRGRSLPGWAPDYGIANWAQFFLKFVISHPALACAIPATSRPDHMAQNIGALGGPLPDAGARRRMAAFFDAL